MTNSLPWNVYPNYIHSRCMHVALGILCDTVCNHKIQEANLKCFPLIVQLPNPSKKCNRVLTTGIRPHYLKLYCIEYLWLFFLNKLLELVIFYRI